MLVYQRVTLLGILFFFAYGETRHNFTDDKNDEMLNFRSICPRKKTNTWKFQKIAKFDSFDPFPWFFQRFSSVFHPLAMETDGATDGAMAGALSPASDPPKAPPARKAVAIPTWKLKIGRTTQPKTTEAITVYLYITLYITHLYVLFVYFFVRWFSGFTIAWVFFQSLDSKSTSSHAKRWCH